MLGLPENSLGGKSGWAPKGKRLAADEVLVHAPPQLSVETEHRGALRSTKVSGLLGTNGTPKFTATEMPRVA